MVIGIYSNMAIGIRFTTLIDQRGHCHYIVHPALTNHLYGQVMVYPINK